MGSTTTSRRALAVLATRAAALARALAKGPAPVSRCASTGRFEAKLLDAVRERVRE